MTSASAQQADVSPDGRGSKLASPTRLSGEQMMWAAVLRTVPVAQRAAAVRAAGVSAMSVFPIDLRQAEAAGQSLTHVRAALTDAGVRVAVLDPYTQWLPNSQPPPGTDASFVDFDLPEVLRMGEAMGIESLSVIEAHGRSYPLSVAVDSFAAVCDAAAERGWRVHLEFIPHTAFPDLASAWAVVQQADRPNGGLVVDVWHYLRGRRDDALLATIPGEKIYRVQVADGLHQLHGDFWNDLVHHRLTPGDGELDLLGVLRVLDGTGGLSSVGPEVFSDAYDLLPPEQATGRAQASVDVLLQQLQLQDPQAAKDPAATPAGTDPGAESWTGRASA